jgi:phosphodiesterase/alkaline phosphatase D-like protein
MKVWSRRSRPLPVLVAALVLGALVVSAQSASAAFNTALQRYPYLTDVTSSSVQVSWATNESSKGIVRWGTFANCAANTVQSTALGSPITVSGAKEYQDSVKISGLSPNTTYCYRVYTGASVDLMGSDSSGVFTTLLTPGDSSSYTLDVFGDWGDTTWTNGALNTGQANVMASMASSGARFALGTGDIACQAHE